MKICKWHLACMRSRPLALQLWASRGQKVKNVKMRKGRKGTKTIDKKCQEDQKLRTIEKKQNKKTIKNDMTHEIGATRLTMQSWQLLIMFTIQDNNDTIYDIDMVHNVDNVDKMLVKCYFYTLPTRVNFFFALFDSYWIYFLNLLSFFLARWNCAAAWFRLPRCRVQKHETTLCTI